MAIVKDINSTERLLNVIRGSQQELSDATEAQHKIAPQQKNSDKAPINFPKVFPNRQRIKVGVDIGPETISLAKVARTSDGNLLLADQKIVKVNREIPKDSEEFKNILKSSVHAFVESPDSCDIWVMMNSAEVNVQYLKIPRVPKKQMENVVYWTAKKEHPFDEKNTVFDYELQGEITDQGIPKYLVMAYSAPKAEVENVKSLFASAGVNLVGVTAASFAIQNFFRSGWMSSGANTFANLYIGYDFSRIDIFHGQNLVMTRGIKTGISSMMEAMEEAVGEISDKPADRERVEKILTEMFSDSRKTSGTDEGRHWTDNDVLEIVTPPLERLTRQIERTFEYYTTSIGYEKVEKVYISSALSEFYHPIMKYIHEQMGTRSEIFNPFNPFNPKHTADSGVNLSPAENVSLVPAIGLALSDRRITPNAIFTYLEKNKEIRGQRINRGIFASFAAAMVICLAILSVQAMDTLNLRSKQAVLEQQLSQYQPYLSKEKVTMLLADLQARHQSRLQYAKKYRALALISELTQPMPENIRLIGIHYTSPGSTVQDEKKGDAAKKTDSPKNDEGVDIEGVVLGERSSQDDRLSQFVMKLENSPMLRNVTLQKSSVVEFKKKDILRFRIHAKIG